MAELGGRRGKRTSIFVFVFVLVFVFEVFACAVAKEGWIAQRGEKGKRTSIANLVPISATNGHGPLPSLPYTACLLLRVITALHQDHVCGIVFAII